MVVPTYLKKRQEQNFSKYHQIQGKVSYQYNLAKKRIASKFHEWNNSDSSTIDKNTLDFVAKYDFPPEAVEVKTDKVIESKSLVQENLNWRRGRVAGTIISIVIIEGVITEKVLLTNKGKRVSIKRKELGIIPKLIYLFTQASLVN